MSFIQTFTGIEFYPFNPKPEMICIEDIAHHLSLINRYTGASIWPYSVAQHCCYVSDLCSDENKLWGLLHDASETWTGDMAGPTKPLLPDFVRLEKKIMLAVCDKFDLSMDEPAEVKYWDRMLLGNEHRALMKKHYDLPYIENFEIEVWDWSYAEYEFLNRFRRLYRER